MSTRRFRELLGKRRSLWLLGLFLLALVMVFGSTASSPVSAASPGYDQYEQYLFDLLNQYRADRGLSTLTYNSALQAQAESHATNSTVFCGHQINEEVISFMSNTDGQEGAWNSLYSPYWNWDQSPPHNAMINRSDFVSVGIGHVWRTNESFNASTSACAMPDSDKYYWVVQFSTEGNPPPAPASPQLVSNVTFSPNPTLDDGSNVTATFSIKNTGEESLQIDMIFLEMWSPNGNLWSELGDQTNVTINGGATRQFSFTEPLPSNEPGNWTVKGIAMLDTAGSWLATDLNGYNFDTLVAESADDGVKILAGYTGGYATHEWKWVTFKDDNGNNVLMEDAPYRLFANICSEIGGDPSHIDIKQPSRSGFYVRVEEDLEFNGIHNAQEGICYIAISENATYLTDRGYEVITQSNPDSWTSVQYNNSYSVLQPMAANIVSENGGDSAHVDLDCGKTLCNIRVEEDQHLNGVHNTPEGIPWVVWTNMPPGMQSGIYGGISSSSGWVTVPFSSSFTSTPIVIARITSENGGDCVLHDIKGLTPTSFKARIEECYPTDGFHGPEKISWMAVEPGVLEE